MINEETLARFNKLSEMCENLRKTLNEHYLDTVEELDYIYDEIDDILHSKKPDDREKKANVVFDGDQWYIETKSGLYWKHMNNYDTFKGYPKNYVDDDILSQIEVLVAQGYEINFEYNIKE